MPTADPLDTPMPARVVHRRDDPGRVVQMGVGLGPSGAIFAVSAALIVAAAVVTQANLLFWGVGLMAGVLTVSLVLPWRVVRGLGVERLGLTHGVCGERLNVRYQVAQHGRLPAFALTLTELWGRGGRGWKKVGPAAERPPRLRRPPKGWVMHLGPRQQAQAEAPCWPMRRGKLAFERVRVATSFPFGVFTVWGDVAQPGEVRVYPHIYRVRRGTLDGVAHLDREGLVPSRRPGGIEEFFGVREYRAGDRPRQIDWKRASRIGRLVTREFTRPGPPRIDLVLDLADARGDVAADPVTDKPWEEDRVERAVSLAASVVCEAHLQGFELGLTVLGADCPAFVPRHNPAHRARILDALSTLAIVRRPDNGLPGRASLLIRLGGGGSSPAGRAGRGPLRHAIVLGAADLHRYVEPASSRRILSELPRTEQRRPRRLHRGVRRETPRLADWTEGGAASDGPSPQRPEAAPR